VKLGFLTTRVGRRFLVVNLLTALVPVAVVTAVSFTYVREELRQQSESRVRRLSKSVGMTTLAYLTSIAQKLPLTVGAAVDSKTFGIVGTSDSSNGLPDASGARSRLTAEQTALLRTGRTLLSLVPSASNTDIVLARALLAWSDSAQPMIWGRVTRAALFEETNEAVDGEDAKLCIFQAQSLLLIHCSPDVSAAEQSIALARATIGGAERDGSAGSEYFISARDVYLRHEYGAPEWRVVVMQPTVAALAGADSFRNTFLLLAAAVVVLIFAVSHAQIRRTTEPLAQLQDGTRRLQAGDFGTPVLVQGDDEYAEVAASFNGMASALHRQITLMHHLDAVDQSALGTRNAQAVVSEALTCVASSVSCSMVSVAIVSPTDHASLATISLDVHTGVRTPAPSQLPSTERLELLGNPRLLMLRGNGERRSYIPFPRQQDAAVQTLVLPLVNDQELLGAITVELHDSVATEDTVTEARRLADRVALALSNVQLVTRLDALSAGTVLAFARAIDANSPWTAGHSERVTRVALEIGRELNLSAAELDTLERGGLLHDIGKIAVPPVILDKRGKLTDDEWAVMRRHTVVGCEILSPIPAFAEALPIVRSHHERMDGTGYPDRLYGDDIPYLARVLAIADVFDALASDRPYRAGMTTAQACEIIQKGSRAHFDPHLVHAFLDAVHAGRIEASRPASDSRSLAAAVSRARGDVPQPA
jgi:putative nucleotidyltransferase with HDIG domain